MSVQNPPNKHHFSPAFYLSGWAGLDGQLTVFRRPGQRLVAHRRHPNAVGYEKGLYSPAGTNYEESFFKDFDTRASEVLKKLGTQSGNVRLKRKEATVIGRYLALAHPSTPEDLLAIQDRIVRAVGAGIPEMEEWFDSDEVNEWFSTRSLPKPSSFSEYAMSEYTAEEIQDIGLSSLASDTAFTQVGTLLSGLSYYVFSTGEPASRLLTSDRPVVFERPLLPSGNLRFPLNPTHLLVGYRDPRTLTRLLQIGVSGVFSRTNTAVCQNAVSLVYATDESFMQIVEDNMSLSPNIAKYLRT